MADGKPISYAYGYDQLHRIASMDAWKATATLSAWQTTAASVDYQERVSYDANGNILKYKRNKDAGVTQDSLNYKYNAGTNQLQYITDNVANNVSTTDIEGQLPNNYIYDKSGNMVADNSQSMSVSWSPYGKILTNTKAGGASLAFGYNAMQQRVLKRVVLAGDTTRTYYIRDAQGNTMGVYTRHNDSVSWREQYIFGSSRLGLYRADTLVNKGLTVISKLYEGKRNYELTNHLGNVMAVINDRKTDSLNGTTKVGFNAVVISATDYYPFGMAIDSRSYTSSLYRYGFNGKENDKEVGEIDFGDRLYDPRIGGRFLSIDFSTKKYPSNTPYSSFNNNPLVFVDPDGNDNIVYILTLQNVPKLIIDRAIEKANAYLRIMGLKTTVVRAEANFDISKLDATDGMVIIGNNKNQVANYVHKTKNFEGIVDTRLLSNNKDDERSVENWHQYKSPDSKGDPNGDTPEISSKNLGLITLNGLEGFKKNLENDLVPGNRSAIKNYEELLGLIIVHSMGHQADVNHNDNAFMRGKDDQYERGFMATGNGLAMHIRGSYGTFKALPIKTVDQLFSNDTTGNNGKPRTESKVVDKMKLRFQPNNEEPKARANEKN